MGKKFKSKDSFCENNKQTFDCMNNKCRRKKKERSRHPTKSEKGIATKLLLVSGEKAKKEEKKAEKKRNN